MTARVATWRASFDRSVDGIFASARSGGRIWLLGPLTIVSGNDRGGLTRGGLTALQWSR